MGIGPSDTTNRDPKQFQIRVESWTERHLGPAFASLGMEVRSLDPGYTYLRMDLRGFREPDTAFAIEVPGIFAVAFQAYDVTKVDELPILMLSCFLAKARD